jgi:iron complex outermembrane receptor protein
MREKTMTKFQTRARALLCSSVGFTLIAFAAPAMAAETAATDTASADAGADQKDLHNADDIIVTGTKVNQATPITSSVHTTEPQSIISRSIIEDSTPATADFSDVILLTPGASGTGNGGGPGLSESKTVLRGFQDGFFNITYDGVPFGDSNNPTHHSTAYFPDGTYERIIVDRGPGGATDLGQASFGGNVHLVSREVDDKFSIGGQAVYGSYATTLGRLTVNSGKIAALGDLKLIAIGEYKVSDTALSGSHAWFANAYIKLEKPLGDNAKLSFLASYNQDLYHQSDNNGVSCTGSIKAAAVGGPYLQTDGNNCLATSQVGTYGKGYGLTEFNDNAFSGTLWAAARRDFNWTNKTTDFEIARLQWNMFDNVTFDNKAYTFFYKNFTVSAADTTTPCTGVITQTTCGGMSTKLAGAGIGQSGGASVAGDIPGYTKVNQYRNYGDILTLTFNTEIGVLKVGTWFERSESHRYRYHYDFTKGFASGALADGHFDFAGMAQVYNYDRSNKFFNLQLNGSAVPAYVNYDEYTSWDQIQGFGEFEFHFLDDRLKVTPGVKTMSFTRHINTPIAAQTSRVGIQASDSYKPTTPYFTVNFLAKPNWSFYAQYAKGFLIPQLSDSLEVVYPLANGGTTCIVPGTTAGAANCNLSPTRTVNYQVGTVYSGEFVNLDFDAYYIEATNSTSTDPSTGISVTNGNPAHYKGVEGQASFRVMSGLTAIVNGSVASAKDVVTGLWLPNAPNYTATAGLIYAAKQFKVSYIHKFTGTQYADGGQLVQIKPYSLGTLSASVKLGPTWLGVTVYNLFDDHSTTKIGSSTGATPLYFFQPGRSYQAQLKFKF